MVGAPPPQVTTKCQPNSGHLDNSCGRITLVFNRDKVPPVSNRSHGFELLGLLFVSLLIGVRLCLHAGNDGREYLF